MSNIAVFTSRLKAQLSDFRYHEATYAFICIMAQSLAHLAVQDFLNRLQWFHCLHHCYFS